jgi:hypothetical protein
MFNRPVIKIYLIFAIAAALFYCVPVYFFILAADYTKSWFLYLGNFSFMILIGVFLFYISRYRQSDPGMMGFIILGEKQVLRSTALALLLSFILLVILIPGLFEKVPAGRIIINKPANTIHDKTNGLVFMVIANAAICNFITGSFAIWILSASLNNKSRKGEKFKQA